ncbi:hypothetical protein TrST_g1614 [Triparma strigata]|uniref:Uncharacterized protein n=1 Tax=Triparma strigata TaxID=1606541 RepID=A0A9W7E2F3_9STRA|nr:hypothetical protein TrST_g1614 [Triparma strigata]
MSDKSVKSVSLAQFQKLQQKFETLAAKMSKYEKDISSMKDMKEKFEEMSRWRSSLSNDDGDEKQLWYSWHWRILLFLGGAFCCSISTIGYLTSDERWGWASSSFWPFSFVCLWGAALGNPRQRTLKNNAFSCLCAFLPGLSCFINGLTLREANSKFESEHRITVMLSWFWIVIGLIFMILLPPAAYGILYKYSRLGDVDLSEAMKTLFQSVPQISIPILFVSSSSIRCVTRNGLEGPVIDHCGNPLIPSLVAALFLSLVFFLSYVISPLLPGHFMSWNDLMRMRLRKREQVQIYLLGALGLLVTFQYANASEDGDDLSSYLAFASYVTFGLLTVTIYFVIFVYVTKPLLCSSSTEEEGKEESDDRLGELTPQSSRASTRVESFQKDMGKVSFASFGVV